jgi:hypothetical protein
MRPPTPMSPTLGTRSFYAVSREIDEGTATLVDQDPFRQRRQARLGNPSCGA